MVCAVESPKHVNDTVVQHNAMAIVTSTFYSYWSKGWSWSWCCSYEVTIHQKALQTWPNNNGRYQERVLFVWMAQKITKKYTGSSIANFLEWKALFRRLWSLSHRLKTASQNQVVLYLHYWSTSLSWIEAIVTWHLIEVLNIAWIKPIWD